MNAIDTKTYRNEGAMETSLECRIDSLEREFQMERSRFRQIFEREAAERRQQFAMLLNELCNAVEKMERSDMELENSLRTELTRQNRFIYEEFRESVQNLDCSLRSESALLRESMIDRKELVATVRKLMEENGRAISERLFA